MKNVLLTTTALVAFAGAAAAEMSFSGGADFGYNDVINGGVFLDSAFNINGSVDLADGYTASFTYGFDVDTSNGNSGLAWDAYPTVEITGPMGSLKGGDLDDAGASEYFYVDRSGMALDVENHDSSARFDVRALVEFGNYGLTIGGDDDGAGNIDGLSVGAGTTFGNFTVAVGYDEGDAGLSSALVVTTAAFDALTPAELLVPATVAAANATDAAANAASAAANATASLATTAISVGTTLGGATVGLSYASNTVDTSVGVEVGYDVTADLSVAAYYADNSGGDNKYGVSAAYAMGDLSLGAYYDSGDGASVDEYGVDVSYAVSGDLTVSAGVYDNGLGGSTDYYVGGVYAINGSLSATVSYATANEISGPEFKDGTTVMLSMSF